MLGDSLNAVRWQGKRQRGFHEVWYLTTVDPATGDAYWFRYTLDAPPQGDVEVGLWAMTTPKAAPKTGLTLHDKTGLAKFADRSTDEKGFRIEVGKYFLERSRATGKVGSGDKAIEWDLKWTPNGIGFEHVSPLLAGLGIAKSAVNSGNLAIEVEGTIKVAGKTIKAAKWPAHQSHTWGSRRPEGWAWAHCNAFAEDKAAVFEGASAIVKKLGMALPAATPIYFRFQGEEHTWDGITEVFSSRSTWSANRWEFEAENEKILLKGVATAAPEKLISMEYAEPDGRPFYVQHATSADLSLEVWKRVGFRWESAARLTSQGTTAFEIATRVRDMSAGRKLDLMDARPAVEEEPPKPAPKPAAAPAAAKPAAPAAPAAPAPKA